MLNLGRWGKADRNGRWVFISSTVLSVCWLAVYLWRLDGVVGTVNIPFLQPHELGALLTGGAAPLALVWALAAIVHQSDRLNSSIHGAHRRIDMVAEDTPEIIEELRSLVEAMHDKVDAAARSAGNMRSHIESSGEAFAEQARLLANTADQAIGRVTIGGEALRTQAVELDDTLERISGRMDDIRQSSVRLSEALDNSATRAEDRLEAHFAGLDSRLSGVSIAIGDASERITDDAEDLRTRIGALTAAYDSAELRAERLGNLADDGARKFMEAADQLERNDQQTQERLCRHADELDQSAQRATSSWESAAPILREQETTFSAAMADADERAKIVRDALIERQELATRLLAEFDAHAESLTRRLASSNSSIARTAETVAAHTNSIREDLKTAADADGRLTASAGATAQRLARLSQDIDEAVSHIGQAQTTLDGTREALGSAAAQAKSAVAVTSGALTRQREEVVAAMEGVHLTARQVGDTLKAQGRTAALTADTVVVKLKQLEGALTGYVEQVQQAGFETVRRTDAVGRVLRDQTQTFDGVADKLEDRAGTLRTALAEHISELLIALDQSMQQAQPVAESFGRYGEALRGAAQIAVREAAALRAAEDNVRRGTFLRSANVVMEDLASTAVDLDKMLSRGVPRAMWRRYTSGDRAAVMRHLAHQIKDTELVAALRERISTDDSFRPHAIRFVTQFERLLRQAAENDPEDLLSVSLLTADVGKVYLALSKATNRL